MYYERGVQPLLPIDTVLALQSPGIREIDMAPVEVLERIKFLHDLHAVVRDAVSDAELKITMYANQKRRDAENFTGQTQMDVWPPQLLGSGTEYLKRSNHDACMYPSTL